MRFAFASLLTHGFLVGALAFGLANDSGHVSGSAGLAGSPRTRFDVTMDSVKATRPLAPKAEVPAPPPVTEGLPVAVKNERPREIDEAPEPVAEPEHDAAPSAGDSATAEAGTPGQGGTGSTAADRLGDSDRTNRLGLYLQKMQRKIQSNLGPAGYLEFPTKARLILQLRRDGHVTKITVAVSSGDAALDRLAIRAVQKSLPFDPWENDQEIQLPVVFR